MIRTWLLMTKTSSDPQWIADQYGDELKTSYRWKHGIPNYDEMQEGDRVVFWDGEKLLGISVIDTLTIVENQPIESQQCPFCFKGVVNPPRVRKTPRYLCKFCHEEFQNPNIKNDFVTLYYTDHRSGWVNVPAVPLKDKSKKLNLLSEMTVNPNTIHSIRELIPEAFDRLLAKHSIVFQSGTGISTTERAMSIKHLQVPPEKLTVVCDPANLGFETTGEIDPIETPIGQDRAISAMELALDIKQEAGFHLLVSGPPGSGRRKALKFTVDRIAATKPKAQGLGYVYNFSQPGEPQAIMLPAGMVTQLRKDMDDAIKECRTALSRMFDSEENVNGLKELQKDYEAKIQRAVDDLNNAFPSLSTVITPQEGQQITPQEGQQITPQEGQQITQFTQNGRVLTPEELESLHSYQTELTKLNKQRDQAIGLFKWVRVFDTVYPILAEIEASFLGYDDKYWMQWGLSKKTDFDVTIREYFAGVLDHILEEFESEDDNHWNKYVVNVLVDHENTPHAPVVVDDESSFNSLFGRIDSVSDGSAQAFMQIKPGSLHKANGGYLVLQAQDLMKWDNSLVESLKRALRTGLIRFEHFTNKDLPRNTTMSPRPEPVPLSIKLIVVGTPDELDTLKQLDEEFFTYFKVVAEFEEAMERTVGNIQKYASFVASTVNDNGLRACDKTAVARLIDYSSRLVENQNKLMTHSQEIIDVITEANYWTESRKGEKVTRQDVQKAITERKYRSSLKKEMILEQATEGNIHIATEGSAVGQVNGLVVSDRFGFGFPIRITAKVSLGRERLISVERDTNMSGPHFDKGFMLMNGYLKGKYGQDRPLSLSASISIEQFEHIDGDSASSTQLYALLSELSGVPISQSIAVTGSINQNGDVQAIGGGNDKIEGFFDLCASRGLDGTHGVIVPKDNLKNLVLKDAVVQAVRDGLFHIYGVSTIDQGMEVLTGIPAGQAGEDGHYTEGTVHQLVESRLDRMARMFREWEREKDREDETPDSATS